MQADDDLLKALAVVLGVSAITSTLSRRLRQPVVLGYVLAGVLIGPHVPVPLVANPAVVHTLSELGVTLVMFSLGLEFSLGKLLRLGAGVAVATVMCCIVLMWLGFVTGQSFGWTTQENMFTGAIVAISSTTVVAKAFEEEKVAGKLRHLVVGALIVEDLVAVLLLTALTALGTGGEISVSALARTAGRLGAFLVGLIVVGMLVVPRAIRYIVRFHQPEATTVTSVGLCFATALLAREMGYSIALGAFIAGALVSESGEEPLIAPLVAPLRDVFAAVFFVSVGMMIDPALIVAHWHAVLALVLLVVVGKSVSVAFAIFFAGHGTRTAIRAGMSLAQIGEFSFIIAALGVSLKATRPFLYPVTVAVAAITTLLTPWLIRASDPVARWVDGNLPRPLQTFATLYGGWIARLGAKTQADNRPTLRRLVRLLVMDAGALGALIILAALGNASAVAFLEEHGATHPVARVVVALFVVALGIPFVIGVVRIARKLGTTLANAAFPPVGSETLDFAAAPRRTLVVALQLACVLLVGAPLLVLTQPFLHGFVGAGVIALLLVGLGVAFWKTAMNLQGHVRAGAQMIVEVLASQSRKPADGRIEAPLALGAILESLGEPVAVELGAASPAVGRTLAELNVRGLTGVTVLAITRGEASTIMPSPRDRLSAGDVLALAGSPEDVDAARAILVG